MIRLPSLTQINHQVQKTARRFPLPVLCSLVLTGLALYLVHQDWGSNTENWMWQSMMTAMLGLVSLTGLTLALETTTNRTRGLFMLLGVTLLGLYWWSLPGDPDTSGTIWIQRHIFLMLGGLVALFWAPFWRLEVDNNVLWRWCTQLIGNAVVTVFFALVLFAGTAAALWSVEMLFELEIDGEFYFDLWVLSAALFSPLFFLAQFDPAPTKLKAPAQVDTFMRIFTQFIMSPLALGYLVILYSYTARVLLTGEWPKNVLGWLVIAFLGVSIFTYFLWTPLLKDAWEKYRRIFWVILIPQIVLLFIAIGWRIHAYSWTENRYFVVVLGLWLLGITIYFLLKRDAKFKWIFVALTGVILVSQLGPLSGYQVGKNSQTERLMGYLEQANIKNGQTYTPTRIDVNDEIENEIASILDYLDDHHGGDTLEQLFPAPMAALNTPYRSQRVSDLMESWGLDYRSKWERKNQLGAERIETFYYQIDAHAPREIRGYDWHVPLSYPNEKLEVTDPAGFPYQFIRRHTDNAPAIEIWQGDSLEHTIELSLLFERILDQYPPKQKQVLPPEALEFQFSTIDFDEIQPEVKFYITSLWGENGEVSSWDAELYVGLPKPQTN